MKKGFTLIEIIVVIAILGILTTIGVAGYQKSTARSRDQRRQADLGLVQTALESYKSQNDTYPSNPVNPQNTTYSDLCSTLVPNYISTLPYDPKSTDPCMRGGSGGGYVYTPNCIQNNCSTYILSAALEATRQTYTINQNGEVSVTSP
jgi:prepilin-type N-terminal cleavage/methylation domain-containing protein